ncbi:TonB-dependent receptor [Sphingomicrobium marinum]|uniref:TonB-dependent receptor n=1 Tax=Sphingomicrobium marinum TaxID=1227950 RepID=UPI00223F483A|nr:TonB-dependent siderophore receptor [Sphingomicrobium marinum]
MSRTAGLLAATAIFVTAPAFASDSRDAGFADAEPGDPIIVTGVRDGYGTDRTSTATKTDSDLNDVPQAVSIITAEKINDQALRSISDIVRFVPGVTASAGEGHRDQLAIRGQYTTADFFSDGLRDDVQHYRGLYNVERVEVVKGPNALIFGRGGGGGIVNRVIKRPFDDYAVSGAVSLDNEGAGFVEIDANSPLGQDISGRLTATYERFDNFRDIEGDRIGVNPTLAFQIAPDTRLDVGYEYAEDQRDVDRGLPSAFDGTLANPARAIEGFDETFFGVRGVNRTALTKHVFDAKLGHDFSDTLSVTSKLLWGDYDKLYRNALPISPVTDIDGTPSVQIESYEDVTLRRNFLWQNDLVAEFATGGVGHTLLVGVDFADQGTDAARLRGFFDTLPPEDTQTSGRRTFVPLADPVAIPPITFRGGSGERAARSDVENFGIYIQDQIAVGDHVEIIAGLRHDWLDIRVQDFIGDTDLSRSDDLLSPRLGVVVKPTEDVSLWASWARSYLPQSGDQFNSLSPTDAALKPEKFTNQEIGIKYRAFDTLDITLAAYRLDRENTTALDPLSSEIVLTGAQRSEGVELEVQGKVGALSVTGGLAFQNAEITEDTTSAPAGRAVPFSPDFQASLWGRYDIRDGLGIGVGISHQSDIFASISNEVVVDGFTRVDAAAFYDVSDNVALQVNVDNLFDEDAIALAYNDNNLYPIAPRTVRGTLRFAF